MGSDVAERGRCREVVESWSRCGRRIVGDESLRMDATRVEVGGRARLSRESADGRDLIDGYRRRA